MSSTTNRARWVGHCTCGTWDTRHELHCGWDIDDTEPLDPAPVPAGPVAALPYAGVPTAPPKHQPIVAEFTHDDLIVLIRWMVEEAAFLPDDITDAVAKPWNYRDELAQARDWMDEQTAKLARSAS